MKYDKVRKTPSQLVSLTGFTELEFEVFVPSFEQHWNEYNAHFTLDGKPRLRISYNRKNSKIPMIKDKLLFIHSFLLEKQPFAGVSRSHLRYDSATV